MKYGVKIPITGFVYVEVEADSEDDAKEKAMSANLTDDNIESWDTCEKIFEGNVFYGTLNEIEIEIVNVEE